MNSGEAIIKVCGITNLEDAELSVRCGANALGYNFYPRSPRFIKPAEAQAIIDRVGRGVLNVGVCVVPERIPESGSVDWGRLLSTVPPGIDVLQIHGVSSPQELPDTRLRMIVATSPDGASRFPDHEIVIDTSWGKGVVADWPALKRLNRSYILSGGLNPGNLSEALETLHPAGVDVCSGVESVPGKKNRLELEEFLDTAVRHYRDRGMADRTARRC